MEQQLTRIEEKLEMLMKEVVGLKKKLNCGGNLPRDKPLPINAQQAADYLHISPSHLYALIYEGKLKPMQRKKHGRILFTRELLDEYLKTS